MEGDSHEQITSILVMQFLLMNGFGAKTISTVKLSELICELKSPKERSEGWEGCCWLLLIVKLAKSTRTTRGRRRKLRMRIRMRMMRLVSIIDHR